MKGRRDCHDGKKLIVISLIVLMILEYAFTGIYEIGSWELGWMVKCSKHHRKRRIWKICAGAIGDAFF